MNVTSALFRGAGGVAAALTLVAATTSPVAAVAPAGVVSVSPGSTPGSISVAFDLTGASFSSLWVLPAAAAPADCSFGAWVAASGSGWNWVNVPTYYWDGPDAVNLESPIEIAAMGDGYPFTLVPGDEYVVCLANSETGYGQPVYGWAAGAGGGSAGASESAPADELQQVPMPPSGSCVDVDASTLMWASSMHGGWSRSWAEWANGSVCTRTLHYDTSSQAWVAVP